jgi:RNA polymerase sigma-70 factor (ECF subfamily)
MSTNATTADNPSHRPDLIEQQLAANLDLFLNFARKRVADPHLAADIVQDSFLKAIRNEHTLRPGENVTAWFFRILRNSLIDTFRKSGANSRKLDSFAAELNSSEAREQSDSILCQCFENILPTLKPEYAAILREVDLQGSSVREAAQRRNRSENATRVRLQRAREKLRQRLEQTCKMCAKHGCLDCSCA